MASLHLHTCELFFHTFTYTINKLHGCIMGVCTRTPPSQTPVNNICRTSRSAAIFERLRNILHESQIDKRVQYMIEVMFAIRKDGFKDHPVIPEGLDLVEEDDQFTHMLPLEDDYNSEDLLSEQLSVFGSLVAPFAEAPGSLAACPWE